MKQKVGNAESLYINPEGEVDLDDICGLDTAEDNLMTDDDLLKVKVTHTIFDTAYPLVAGMKYQGNGTALILTLLSHSNPHY